MATYIVLNKDIVDNIIVADTLEIAEALTKSTCVLHTNNQPVSIGWIYNSATQEFSAPE